MAGQAVIGYTGQYYALFFLQAVLKLDFATANTLVAWALLITVGGFVLFGWLSDVLGRKPIIVSGLILAALTTMPLYQALTRAANPALADAHNNVHVTLHASHCSFQFNPVGTAQFEEPCDVAKQALNARSVNYDTLPLADGQSPSVAINEATRVKVGQDNFRSELNAALTASGYPLPGDARSVKTSNFFDIFRAQPLKVLAILTIIGLYVTMTFGPVAAALVELFPTRIRYTAMSFPFHVGTGWFGGLLPAIATALVLQEGNVYFGLWYPIVVSALTALVAVFFLPERSGRDLSQDVD